MRPKPLDGSPVLPALALALGLCACSGEEERAPARRVILISCDTLRADRLGAYGYERETSPHLDALAREGVVFDEAYSCAPHTGPALSSLFASRMPDEIGVAGGNRSLMPPEVLTFPEVLREAGIMTAAVVSNWALRRETQDNGVQQGFAHYDDRMSAEEPNRPDHYERVARETTDAALEWLDARAAAGEDRFFLWVHYMDPHGPYTPPAEYAQRFDRPHDGEPSLGVSKSQKGFGRIPSYQVLGSERRPGFYRDRYDAEIRYFDEELGRLLDGLAQHELVEDSILIFTADHGESQGEHDYWFCHGENVFREAVRVPLVVRYPADAIRPRAARDGGPARVSEIVSHLDLWPTVLEAFDLPPGLHRGTSLLAAELPAERLAAHTLGIADTAKRWVGVSDGRFQLVTHGEKRWLFDVREDPAGTTDVSASQSDVVHALEQRYERFLELLPASAPVVGAEMSMDEENLRAMQALGYVEGADGED